MTFSSYQRLVRSSAIYDLIVTTLFAFPIIAAIKINWFHQLHNSLGLAGSFPVFEPMHLFFVNLMGSVVTVWSVLRVVKPEALFGLYDGVGRALFSIAMAYYLFFAGGTSLLWAFLIPEVIWGVVQLTGYWRLSDKSEVFTMEMKSKPV